MMSSSVAHVSRFAPNFSDMGHCADESCKSFEMLRGLRRCLDFPQPVYIMQNCCVSLQREPILLGAIATTDALIQAGPRKRHGEATAPQDKRRPPER